MSETWTQECQECGGMGEKAYSDTSRGRGIGGQMISAGPCLPCSGSGGFNLVVACGQSGWDLCDLDMDAFCTGDKPSNCKESYRPLQVKEVEEMVLTEITLAHPELMLNQSVRELMIKQTIEMQVKGEINLTYKGSPVKLQPREVK